MHRLSLHSPFSRWKKGDPLASPFVQLSLGSYSQSEEHILLSPQLMTDKEVDETVDKLRDELEEFRRRAKKELRDLHAKIMQK